MILDCQTEETTLKCISNIFSINESSLIDFLKEIDLDNFYNSSNPLELTPPQKLLTSILKSNFKATPNPLSNVYWFHLTRVFPFESFENGILPLNQVINKIWCSIFKIVPEHADVLKTLRSSNNLNYLYNLKINNSAHHGPYAVLVRDIAFCESDLGKHFLELPEIIDDICNSYHDFSGTSIHKSIMNETKPCIVKFKSNKRLENDCIESAVYYLYLKMNNQPLNDFANTSYNSNNIPVPRADILNIDFIAL